MSSTAATATTDSHEYRPGIPAEDAFNEIAFYDPTTCSRCFSLIRTHDTYRPDVGIGGVSQHAPQERLRRAFDGEKGFKTEPVDVYGYRPLHEPRTFCESCGAQSGRADDDSLSQRQAMVFVDNLLTRLQEARVRVHEYVLKYAVEQMKADDRITNYDTEIFRRATKLAIQHARRGRDREHST